MGSLLVLLFNSVSSAQTLEELSYTDLVGRCSKATAAKSYRISSGIIQGPQTQTAQTKVLCWKEGDRHVAMSELWIDGKKVYSTSESILGPQESSCGLAVGEIYKPHSFSPDGNRFAFLSEPFCWATEPMAPMVIMTHLSDRQTKVLNLKPIVKEILQRYPKLKKVAKTAMVDFFPSLAGWRGKENLLIDVEVLCYGCVELASRTRWTITPKEKFEFGGELWHSK